MIHLRVLKEREINGLTCNKLKKRDALAIGSVTGVQASPKRIILWGGANNMSKKAFIPTAALHCIQSLIIEKEEKSCHFN